MKTREEFHEILCTILGTRNVYYQPPENLKLVFPAIVYKKTEIEKWHASDGAYKFNNRYDVMVISKKPDSSVINELLKLPYSSYDRHYVVDNMYHDSLKIYF